MTLTRKQNMDTSSEPTISRRTLTKAMAWSVPVVAIAIAAPAASASGELTITGPEPLEGAVGDSLPLVFEVLLGGVPVASGSLVVQLSGTDVVVFDPTSDDYTGSETLITVQITDGQAFALVVLVASGSVSGVASVGSASALFAGSVVVS